MNFHSKVVKGSNNFIPNTKFKSLLLGLKDIDKVDTIDTNLTMMSLILGHFHEKNDSYLDKKLSKTSMIFLNLNKTLSYKKW